MRRCAAPPSPEAAQNALPSRARPRHNDSDPTGRRGPSTQEREPKGRRRTGRVPTGTSCTETAADGSRTAPVPCTEATESARQTSDRATRSRSRAAGLRRPEATERWGQSHRQQAKGPQHGAGSLYHQTSQACKWSRHPARETVPVCARRSGPRGGHSTGQSATQHWPP